MTSLTKRKERKRVSEFKPPPIEGKTDNQSEYIRSIKQSEIVVCTGPSGSGKSYIAAGLASKALLTGRADRVVVTRPLICTGKGLGHLPGDVMEKISPYLSPMMEHFRHFLGNAEYGNAINYRRLCYQPLEVMRGSTFDESWMILDEAQNCTEEQIKMFITRMGKNSKVLVNGDIKQTDLRSTGLTAVSDKLASIEGVSISRLTREDIQRNGIIARVLDALEL